MNSGIFLDSGYLIALIRKRDNFHRAASEASELYTGPFLTTDLILMELANSLAKPPHRSTVVMLIERIQSDRNTTIVPFSSRGMSKAFALFKSRSDKTWGLVDCFSFVVMKEKEINQALTFDEHFQQAGFYAPLLA
jgi:uncharacterized protein